MARTETTPTRPNPLGVDFIIRYEAGEATEDEILDAFQWGIDNGVVWQLQGFYGRTAEALIDAGLCVRPTGIYPTGDGDFD